MIPWARDLKPHFVLSGNSSMPMRTRVKICGLTREQDVLAAVDSGVDAIGLVFVDDSPRAIVVDQALELVRHVPAFVQAVGLFVDPSPAQVEQVLARVPLSCLQFHGRESPEFCESFGLPWIKAVAMRDELDLAEVMRRYDKAASLLLDAFDPNLAGGTGRRFDWGRVPVGVAAHIILAGGLDPSNVRDAIRDIGPYAVDVSGGVEATKGIKDPSKIAQFMQGVRDGDTSR